MKMHYMKECVNVKRLLILLLCFIFTSHPALAYQGYGATGVEVTQGYVHVDSALPTTGGFGYTRFYDVSFVNRCPNCGGGLYYEEGPYSGAAYTSPEGLWACIGCDMDFCCVSGRSHDDRGFYLERYELPLLLRLWKHVN